MLGKSKSCPSYPTIHRMEDTIGGFPTDSICEWEWPEDRSFVKSMTIVLYSMLKGSVKHYSTTLVDLLYSFFRTMLNNPSLASLAHRYSHRSNADIDEPNFSSGTIAMDYSFCVSISICLLVCVSYPAQCNANASGLYWFDFSEGNWI